MIIVVSGLPRSGTSLAMQMLAAGGLPILSDGMRESDPDNPRGYYEWEQIKRLASEPSCLAEAEGKAVKVISSLLFALPPEREYRVIFMLRPLDEVLASQAVMIRNRGSQAPALAPHAMLAALTAHRAQVEAWLGVQQNVRAGLRVLKVSYLDLMADPRGIASAMARFLVAPLDVEAMVRQVDSGLYRQRRTPDASAASRDADA